MDEIPDAEYKVVEIRSRRHSTHETGATLRRAGSPVGAAPMSQDAGLALPRAGHPLCAHQLQRWIRQREIDTRPTVIGPIDIEVLCHVPRRDQDIQEDPPDIASGP
jgi:hypothetical protein